MPFSGVFGTKGPIRTGCAALLPDINRRPNLCPPGAGPTRLRQEGWLRNRRVWIEIASEAKRERAERKKVLALAQARRVDVILVTEPPRWGRSTRFATRSLTRFKQFRFVSSPPSVDFTYLCWNLTLIRSQAFWRGATSH
jgi:Resolvase, N terminal domain